MNTNIPQLLSAVRLCDPCRAPKQPVWKAISAPCFCVFDCCFIQQFHSTTPLAKLTRNPEKSLLPTLCDFVTLLSHFGFFSVTTKTSTPNQPWEGFCLRTKKTNIEDPYKIKVVNPNPHSTICNSEPKPSFVLDTPHLQSQQLPSPDICSSPQKSSQDVDESHLSDSTSTTTNLNEAFSMDTSCDHLLHLDSTNISSEL